MGIDWLARAYKYLDVSQECLDDCHLINDTIEGRLGTTPKPSEMLNYSLNGLSMQADLQEH